MDVLPQLIANTLVTASIYALAASGLSFIYATTRVFHFGHGAVVGLGAFMLWWLWFARDVPMVLAVILTVLTCTAVGVAMNECVYEPLRRRKAKGFTFLVAAIALLMLGNAALLAIFGSSPQSVALYPSVLTILGARVTTIQMAIVVIAAVLLCGLAIFVRATTFGQAMRATADNEMVATVLGINPIAVRRLTFAIGSALAGVAGMLLLLELNADPNMGVMIAIKSFTAIVVGGAGTMEGAIVGSLLLSGVEQASAWTLGGAWKNAVGFVLLFVFLLFRPSGIFGRKRYQ